MLVHQIHWLRSRAQRNRWQEELVLLTYEMEWTVKSFIQQSQKPLASVSGNTPPGPLAYAHRQHAKWQDLASSADKAFRSVNLNYKSPM
jgi:hypothetical protein